jgi:hypothetical protein
MGDAAPTPASSWASALGTSTYLDLVSGTYVLGRVPIIAYGGYGPRPASKTDHFFAVLISRPSSGPRLKSVPIRFDGF